MKNQHTALKLTVWRGFRTSKEWNTFWLIGVAHIIWDSFSMYATIFSHIFHKSSMLSNTTVLKTNKRIDWGFCRRFLYIAPVILAVAISAARSQIVRSLTRTSFSSCIIPSTRLWSNSWWHRIKARWESLTTMDVVFSQDMTSMQNRSLAYSSVLMSITLMSKILFWNVLLLADSFPTMLEILRWW